MTNDDFCQAQVELALNLWTTGDREGFKKIIREQLNTIATYRGRGDIMTYFVPSLFIKEFSEDLINAGFPFEKIVNRNYGCLAWLDYDQAISYMAKVEPSFLKDIVEEGIPEEAYYPLDYDSDSENYEIMMQYFPVSLRRSLEMSINTYFNSSDELWEKRVERCKDVLGK